MAVVGTGSSGSKYLKREWPNIEGTVLGTTKLEGGEEHLVEEGC